jgi:S1-C subfamily serine protease
VRVNRRTSLAFLAAGGLLALPAGAQDDADEPHREIYRKTAGSVVAVRALAPLGERSGSGFVLDASGLLVTSYACCPEGSSNVRVWIRGPRRYDAEIVASSREDELTLLRIKPDAPLPPVVFGDSTVLRPGQRSYTLGNAANSIILDDQPSFNLGIVSALYRLDELRANATYRGPVFETTAAVNVGMEGAPCLDAEGRVVGMVTLNYASERFLGVAIPAAEFLPPLRRLVEKAAAAAQAPDPAPAGAGSAGLDVELRDGRLVVRSVTPGGPADRAGIGPGDVLLEAGKRPLRSLEDFRTSLQGLEAGAVLWLKLEIGGAPEIVKLTLEAAR